MQAPSTATYQFNDSITIKNSDKQWFFKNNVTFSDMISTDTRGLIIPTGTSFERPTTPYNGLMRFNSTFKTPEIYYNGEWIQVATTYSILADINPKTLINTNDTATVTGKDFVPGMVFEFIGATNISYLVNTYTYVDSTIVILFRPANMPIEEEPYTLRATLPNGPMYELKDIVEVGPVI
jgi:hypothetical protein